LLAAFPWYDLPSVRWANDVLWRATGLPGELSRRVEPVQQWHCESLCVSQACGLDLFLTSAPIEPVLVPIFDLDCPPGTYFSYLVGSDSSGVAAVNSLSSRSGFTALLTMCAPRAIVVTGSHTQSLSALRSGVASVASIDAVVWHILARDYPKLISGFEVIGRSQAATAPPYVMRRGGSQAELLAGLRQAHADPMTESARQALLVKGVRSVSSHDYLEVWAEYERTRYRQPPIVPAS